MKYLKTFNEVYISDNFKYHMDNTISITESIFRHGSDSYIELLKETRNLYISGHIDLLNEDKKLFDETDIGYMGNYNGQSVPLDIPLEDLSIYEADYKGHDVELNLPKRNSGSGKKYYVYVKNPKTGKVKKINFGDMKGGLTAKVSDPKARKSFAARHNCDMKKDKMTAGYWACRINRYANLWGGKTYPGYW